MFQLGKEVKHTNIGDRILDLVTVLMNEIFRILPEHRWNIGQQ